MSYSLSAPVCSLSAFVLRVYQVLTTSIVTLSFVLTMFMLSSYVHANDELASAKSAQGSMASSVTLNDVWARATFAMAKSGAAYFSITNNAQNDVVLTAVSVNDSVAMTTQLHQTVMKNNMMSMQELAEGIEIKPGETLELSPGGMHVMIMGLQQPLNQGESIVIDLFFEDGSKLSHIFPILDKRK